jgi:hypothetical protein
MRFDALYIWRLPNGIGGLSDVELTLDEGRARDAERISGPVRVVRIPETPDEILESWMAGEAYMTSRALDKMAA